MFLNPTFLQTLPWKTVGITLGIMGALTGFMLYLRKKKELSELRFLPELFTKIFVNFSSTKHPCVEIHKTRCARQN